MNAQMFRRQHHRIDQLLNPAVKGGIAEAARAFMIRAEYLPPTADLYRLAAFEITLRFGSRSEKEMHVLVVQLFGEVMKRVMTDHGVASFGQLDACFEGWDDKRKSQGDLAQELSIKVQKAMERYEKFFERLSDMMKKLSDTSSDIISNMK